MAIGENKSSGTWWKVLLGVLGGFILGIGAVAGGVVIAGTMVSTKTLLGEENAKKYLGEKYQDKTIYEIVMSAVGGELKFNTLGDLNEITPLVSEYVTGIRDSLNDLGCELTNEEMFKWELSSLADNVIGAVKGAKIIRVLSKDNIDYPDPVIKYLSYQTYPDGHEHAGEYVTTKNEAGEDVLVDQHLSDMLDNANYIQTKVDSMRIKMLFTEEDIAKSSMLSAIKDKSVKDLSKDGAFDDVKLSAVFTVDSSSPLILKNFVKNEVTIGGMSEAINDLKLSDVIEITDTSPQILKTFNSKGTKVNEMNDAIDDLKLGEAMELHEGDLLWKVRDDRITELNDIDAKLTVEDVFPDHATTKFIKDIPADTPINQIGSKINDIKLIQAFDENIYDGDGDSARIRPTWKYLLAETQEELDGLYDPLDLTKTKTRGSNPFSTYGCRFYTLGGNGTGSEPDKGINGLIENMKNNMNRVKLSQLDQDGMV
ncbi:MAG: hypothetical protein J5880_01155, partial [Bacilli bacterium]|nr:hypothetical protein [Bacilli bacterium]